MILDIGCGKKEFRQHNAIDEFNISIMFPKQILHIDLLEGDDIDIQMDINKFLNTYKSKVNGILFSHVLEHFTPYEQINILNKSYEILNNGGKIIIYCPHYSSAISKTHLTHQKLIGYNTYDNFLPNAQEKYSKYNFNINKKIIFGKLLKIFEPICNKFPCVYEQYFSGIIPAREIRFELIKIM